MGLVAMSGEIASVAIPRTDWELIIKTKRGEWVEVGFER